jgi:hypothetical protein
MSLCIPVTFAQVSSEPVREDRANNFLVIYCLKSNSRGDVKETLMFLQASWRLNHGYKKAKYVILRYSKSPFEFIFQSCGIA